MPSLSELEKTRYSRHLMLEEVSTSGQEKLKNAKVLIIGAGALGAPNALYLAGAGIGTIGIIDDDVVDISNLHRQVIYRTQDIGRPKIECAKEAMLQLNPEIKIQTHLTRFEFHNARQLIKDYDLVIDATDNFVSKFLINDSCVFAHKPFIHAGIMRHCGQIMSIIPYQSACLACIFPTPPQNVKLYKNGLFGSLTGSLGSMMANEALKFFTGVGEMMTDSLLSLNLAQMEFSKLKIKKNPSCPICGENSLGQIRQISCNL